MSEECYLHSLIGTSLESYGHIIDDILERLCCNPQYDKHQNIYYQISIPCVQIDTKVKYLNVDPDLIQMKLRNFQIVMTARINSTMFPDGEIDDNVEYIFTFNDNNI